MVRKLILLTVLFLLSTTFYCQNEKQITDIETTPFFDGDLVLFIQTNLLYPKTAIDDTLEGTVIVELWVDTIGNTYGHIIVRSIREDLDNEALRVTSLISFKSPAKQRDKPIVVRLLVPVKFNLTSTHNKSNSTTIFNNRRNYVGLESFFLNTNPNE